MSKLLLLVVLALCVATQADDVILKPIKSGTEIGVIFIQGASITPSQYVPLMQAIQEQSPQALWFGAPEFALDVPEPFVLAGGIERVLTAMQQQGMTTTSIFFMAHSLGGAMVQDYVNSTFQNATGQVLMGSFLTRKYRGEQYPVPTLTLAGELDGLCRVTRIAESYYHSILNAPDFTQAVQSEPVVVLKGVSHMQFASGTPPSFVAQNDLKPEVSYDDAHTAMAQTISDFVNMVLGDSDALANLKTAVQGTGDFVQPIIDALNMEGFYHFKPPCYDNPPSDACFESNPWTEQAQQLLGGLQNVTVVVTDAFHPVSQINPIHLPAVNNNCTLNQPNCVLNVTTVTENAYDALDGLDTGFSPIAAAEIRAKLKSRQAMLQAIGYADADFNVTDAPSLCAQVNQEAFNWALAHSGASTVQRFNTYGEPVIMGDDLGPYNIGPLWIWNPLQYNNGTSGLTIQSPMNKTPTVFIIPAAAGMHYCKLYSPARAMEWIYIDSLREKYHI